MAQHRPDSSDFPASPRRASDATGGGMGRASSPPDVSDVLITSDAAGAESWGGIDADFCDMREVIAALDEDGAERLARDLPPGLIERITTASAAHLPLGSLPVGSLLGSLLGGSHSIRLDANDLHADAPHAGVWAPSAARRHASSVPGGRRRVLGTSRLGLSIRSVLSMAAAIALAFVATMPFVPFGPFGALHDAKLTDSRGGLSASSSQPSHFGLGGADGTPFTMAASSRNESTLVMLLQDRRAPDRSAGGRASISPSTISPGASAAFANLRVFPISAEPNAGLTSLLDVRDTDVGDLAAEFSRIQRATGSREGAGSR